MGFAGRLRALPLLFITLHLSGKHNKIVPRLNSYSSPPPPILHLLLPSQSLNVYSNVMERAQEWSGEFVDRDQKKIVLCLQAYIEKENNATYFRIFTVNYYSQSLLLAD